MRPLTLQIEGMSCGHCLNAVNKALGGLQGVTIRSVQIGRAELDFDEGRVDPATIVAAVEGQGYHTTVQAQG